jgi:hypothetical protein
VSEPEDTTPDEAREERLSERRERARKKRLRVAGMVAGAVVAVALLLAGLGFAAARLLDPGPAPVMLTPEQMEPAGVPAALESMIVTSPAEAATPTVESTPSAEASSAQASTVAATVTPAPTPSGEPEPFDTQRAMATVTHLARTIGPRAGGSAKELQAAQHIAAQLRGYGYTPVMRSATMPDGTVTHSILAQLPGASPAQVVVGAHIDSKGGAPGGNDNASGAATVLELARIMRNAKVTPTLVFVWFGAEEMIDSDPNHHHYGSRALVRSLTQPQRNRVAGMISVDMIGVGDRLLVRSMGRGPQSMVGYTTRSFTASGSKPAYLKDASAVGNSDHEPFELAGIPAVWVEWQSDPAYHTKRDTAEHVDTARIGQTGSLLRALIAKMTVPDMNALLRR